MSVVDVCLKKKQNFDQAGVVTNDEYDFKGNLLRNQRQLVVFFKQKTAYDIPLCDWSSDVCSSDLGLTGQRILAGIKLRARQHRLHGPWGCGLFRNFRSRSRDLKDPRGWQHSLIYGEEVRNGVLPRELCFDTAAASGSEGLPAVGIVHE